LRSFLIPVIIFNLSIDRDLDVKSTVIVIRDHMPVIVPIFTLGIKNAALAVAVNFDTLLCNVTDGVRLVWVWVDVENRVGGVSGVRAGGAGATRRRMGSRVGSSERSTVNERPTDGEDDAHGHGRGKNGSHAMEKFRVSAMFGGRDDKSYLVTMVLTASSEPVGLIMNQNKTLVMLTIQMDYGSTGS
jgi:hypothetical protein